MRLMLGTNRRGCRSTASSKIWRRSPPSRPRRPMPGSCGNAGLRSSTPAPATLPGSGRCLRRRSAAGLPKAAPPASGRPFHHIPAPGRSRRPPTTLKWCSPSSASGYRVDITPGGEELSAMRMMVAILGGTATSKLFLNVREKQSLCYYCGANLDRTKGIVLIDSGVRPDNAEAAKAAIFPRGRGDAEGGLYRRGYAVCPVVAPEYLPVGGRRPLYD